MALILIKEDGTGKVDANAYADDGDGDDYHEGHLYASAWTAATLAKKEAALVMATRLIDAEFQFGGVKASGTQALQWPRRQCRIPDFEDELPANVVPKAVLDATCETARALLIEDRTANPAGEGLKFQSLAGLQQSFDKADRRPVLPRVALALLGKFGAQVNARSGAVKLVRT